MLAPRTSVIPPGGWHFIDRSGSTPIRIEAEGADELAQRVLSFRLSNHLPPGDPLQEVTDYICTTWPHFCTETNPTEAVSTYSEKDQLKRAHPSVRVASWMSRFFQDSRTDAGVSQRIADSRATTCSQCPQNKPFDNGGCGSCIDSIKRLAFVWIRNRSTERSSLLGGCAITGQHNGCAVFADRLPEVSEEDRPNLPENCWRK